MNQDEKHPTSFLGLEPDDLVHAKKLDEEPLIDKSSYQESWSVVWAPDSSYVAWSQGGGIVFLLPWDQQNGRILKRPARDRSYGSLPRLDSTDADLNNLCRLPEEDSNSDDDDYDNIYDLQRQQYEVPDVNQTLRKQYRIDCMDYVWSMAFGHGVTQTAVNVHRRFTFKSDLILATGLQSGKIKLWNVYAGSLLMELLDHKNVVHGLSFKCDGSLGLVSCSSDCTIKFWDLNHDGNMYKTLRFKENVMVFSCKWSPSCKQVAAVGMNKCAYVWNTDDLNNPRKLSGHLHNVTCCDYSPDGAILATSSYDTRVILWDPYTGDQIKVLGHMFPSPRPIYAGGANGCYVRGVSFGRDGHQLVTVADDGYVRFWSLDSGDLNPSCIAESRKLLSCSFCPNSQIAAVGGKDGRIEIYQAKQMALPSLQQLCRVTLRKRLGDTGNVNQLHYPAQLKEFLRYRLF